MVNAINGGLAQSLDVWPPKDARAPQSPRRLSDTNASPTEVLTRWCASKLGLSEPALATATAGGRLSTGSDAAGTLRAAGANGILTAKGSIIPTTADGIPDIEAMTAAGAEIVGAATDNGYPFVANHSQFGLKAYWAFQVDLHDGNGPQWVKGGTADPGPDASAATRAKVFADLVDTVDRLPNSLIEFMSQLEHREGTLYDDKPPHNRIDLMA